MTELTSTAQKAVDLAMKRGFDEAEAFCSKVTRREIIYRDRIEATKSNTVAGLSVRGILNKRVGFYSISSVDQRELEKAVDQAMKIARANQEDTEWHSLPSKYGKSQVKKVIDRNIETLTARDLVDEVKLAVDTVRQVDPSLTVTRGYISTAVQENAIANSHGCGLKRKETVAASWISVKAGSEENKGVSHESSESHSWRDMKTEHIARTVSERAVKMLKAKPISNGKVNTVWHNVAFGSIVDVMLSRTITADAVQMKRSPWAGKLGQKVASDTLSIIDNGKMIGGMGTREFDDDGTPQRRTPVIENGVLRNFLYDSYTAKKDNRLSTGNAHRDVGLFASAPNYMKTPSPYPNNLVVKPTNIKPEEVIRETKNGLFVVETIGEWLSNPVSGDVSATLASGFLIENGELGRAVKGVILTSNFFDIMKGGMGLRARDLEISGSVYAPTTQILNMTIAGE